MSRLSIRNVSKSYFSRKKSLLALSSANLDIGEGEFICLVGPSGCGKTTLLNMIAGLIKSDTGSISYDGEIISGPGLDRTVVFQDFALFPWLNVLHNVEFGLRFTGIPRAKRLQIALENLKSVGLDNFAHARIHELSGGMKQRVAIARALALRPRVLLMDEPFAGNDIFNREDFYKVLLGILTEQETVLEEEPDSHLLLSTGSGLGRQNPAVVELEFDADSVTLTAWAKEGLIPQRTAQGAIKGMLELLGL